MCEKKALQLESQGKVGLSSLEAAWVHISRLGQSMPSPVSKCCIRSCVHARHTTNHNRCRITCCGVVTDVLLCVEELDICSTAPWHNQHTGCSRCEGSVQRGGLVSVSGWPRTRTRPRSPTLPHVLVPLLCGWTVCVSAAYCPLVTEGKLNAPH